MVAVLVAITFAVTNDVFEHTEGKARRSYLFITEESFSKVLSWLLYACIHQARVLNLD